jgi:hypothetical protein
VVFSRRVFYLAEGERSMNKPKVSYEHPRYPGLIVQKVKANGNIKIRGMRRCRHPRYPFLMELSKAERKQLAKGIDWLIQHRNQSNPAATATHVRQGSI